MVQRQAIIWTNDVLGYQRIYSASASMSLNINNYEVFENHTVKIITTSHRVQ